MTILDSKGKLAPGSDEATIQSALRHWLDQQSVLKLLSRLKLVPPWDALSRLWGGTMDPGEAAKIFRAIILNKQARKFLISVTAQRQHADESRLGLERELLAMADRVKPQGHASKSGLIIP